MSHLVTEISQALTAIQNFQTEVASSTSLQDRLGYARSWYFIKNGDDYIYAPSKWVGYVGMTAEVYVSTSKEIDGRKTEEVLGQWYDEVSASSRAYSFHIEKLKAFLGQYGKSPSSAVRFNVLAIDLDNSPDDAASSKLVDLLSHVISELPAEAQARLKKRAFS